MASGGDHVEIILIPSLDHSSWFENLSWQWRPAGLALTLQCPQSYGKMQLFWETSVA